MQIIVEQVDYNKDVHDIFIERLNLDYDLAKVLTEKSLLVGQVKIENNIIGLFIFRIEQEITGDKELVICHVVSDKTSISNFTDMVLPFVKQLARQNKIKTLRLHTIESKTQRLAEKYGFKFFETVLVCEVENGQG